MELIGDLLLRTAVDFLLGPFGIRNPLVSHSKMAGGIMANIRSDEDWENLVAITSINPKIW
jgi:hypothetical protein